MKRKTIEWLHELAKKRNGTCLAENYENSVTYVMWKCENPDHPPFSAKPTVINSGSWCKLCWLERRKKHNINIGQKFTRLTIIKELDKKEKEEKNLKVAYRYMVCDCDCGKKNLIIRLSSILQEDTKSCGCWFKDMEAPNALEEGEAYLNTIMGDYQRGATKRHLGFFLSREQLKHLITQDCFYCGIPPQSRPNRYLNGQFDSHGIDRFNTEEQYTVENCVACCTDCNEAKNSQIFSNFIAAAEAINNNEISIKNKLLDPSRTKIIHITRNWSCVFCYDFAIPSKTLNKDTKCRACGKENFTKDFAYLKGLVRKYKYRCERRDYLVRNKITFDLSLFETLNIISGKCFYCNKYPCEDFLKDRYMADRPFEHHTIDRIDPNIAYMLSNCVPCCQSCNIFKWDRTIDEMLDHAKRINTYQQNKYNNIWED